MHTDHDEAFEALAGALAPVAMDTGLDEIVARGQSIRGRRRALTAGIGTGTAAVAALALIGGASTARTPAVAAARTTGPATAPAVAPSTGSGAATGQADRAVDVDLAAYSVHTNPDRTVTVTVRQVFDPAQLRSVLARAGIDADIEIFDVDARMSTYCPLRPGDMPVSPTGAMRFDFRGVGAGHKFIIDPSRLPAGTVVSFRLFVAPGTTASNNGPLTIASGLFHGAPARCVPVPKSGT